MMTTNKLFSIEDIEKLRDAASAGSRNNRLFSQFADTMRENERLLGLVDQRFKDGKRLGIIETEDRFAKEIQYKHPV